MSATRQVVCGSCGRINRLPAERAPQGARCGACHQAIFTGHPLEVDEQGFERHVANSDIPLLVDVWAPWCGPCRAMAPVFAQAAAQFEPRVRLAKVDTEAVPALAARFSIRSIPTLIAFRDGREIARQSGALDGASLQRWLRSLG